MESDAIAQFGNRIQRCYGCFIAYHLKDMYLGEDVTFFCEHCKDETMFHFDDFSKLLDVTKTRRRRCRPAPLTCRFPPRSFSPKIELWPKRKATKRRSPVWRVN